MKVIIDWRALENLTTPNYICIYPPYLLNIRSRLSDCPCIEVTGGQIQSAYNGVYYLINSATSDLKPSYKHSVKDQYVYHINDPVKYWMFGPENGITSGYLVAFGDASDPGQETKNWLAYNEVTSRWMVDENVTVDCNCPGMLSFKSFLLID